MRSTVAATISVVCGLVCWGCQPARVSYVAVEQAAPESTDLFGTLQDAAEWPTPGSSLPCDKVIDADVNLPKIQIEVRFIEASLAELETLGMGFGPGVHRVDADQLAELCAWAQSDVSSSIISSPRLVSYSGSPASLMIGSFEHYVRDFDLSGDESADPWPQPVVGTVRTGRTFDVLATIDGDDVVLNRLVARTSRLLGRRFCTANVIAGSGARAVEWEEPQLIQGIADLGEDSAVRVAAGEYLVLSMRYQVVQSPAANIRAAAAGGRVSESYAPESHRDDRFDGPVAPRTGRTSDPSPALSRQCLVIVSASPAGEDNGALPRPDAIPKGS